MTYPTELPSILEEGNSRRRRQTLIVTEMDSGQPRYRNRFANAPDVMRGMILLPSKEDLDLFEAWYEYDSDFGARLTLMPITDARGTSTLPGRIVEEPVIESLGADRWRVRVVIEFSRRRVMSEQDYENRVGRFIGPDFDPNDWDPKDFLTVRKRP